MDRREEIQLTIQQIKVAKKLVAQQVEFIFLAKAIGYEPTHATATLERFCAQLSEQRRALVRLTRSGPRRQVATRTHQFRLMTRHAA